MIISVDKNSLYNSNTHGELEIVRVIECSSNRDFSEFFCKIANLHNSVHRTLQAKKFLPCSLRKDSKTNYFSITIYSFKKKSEITVCFLVKRNSFWTL